MKKVYIIRNWYDNEIMAVTEDRGLAEEYIMDFFEEDIEGQWYLHQRYVNATPELAQQIWNNMLEWYDEFIELYEKEIW